jgi:hypothetical protein
LACTKFETVMTDTPAAFATSLSVARASFFRGSFGLVRFILTP